MMRILIGDDHPIVRRGLKEILAAEPDVRAVGEAQTGQELLERVKKEHWDIVVLDIGLPDKSGLDVLKEAKQERPKLPVLVLSMHPEDQYAVRVLKAGAAGYLTKETAPEELVKAIRAILRGRKYVSSSLAERLALGLERGVEAQPYEVLSDREYQVMRLIASGKSVTDIAEELSLSVKTVSTYRSRVLEKLGVKTTAELIRYAIHNRLVD